MIFLKKSQHFRQDNFWEKGKPIALQKSSNFSKKFSILKIVLLPFMWSEKRGIELSFQIRVLFLKKSQHFRRDNFWEKSKPIALQKTSNFSKNFFVLRTVLLAFIWSEKRGIELSFQIRVWFLKKSHFFQTGQFLRESKSIALQKSSNFSKIFFYFENSFIGFYMVRKKRNWT